MENYENLISDVEVQQILKDIKQAFSQESQSSNNISIKFQEISSQLQSFLNRLQKEQQQYENAYNAYIQSYSKSKSVKKITQTKLGQQLINTLTEGYILLQAIRQELVGDTINYTFVKQYSGRTVAYHMSLGQLLQYTRKKSFVSLTGELASLGFTMKGLAKTTKDEIEQDNLTLDPLYNSVMSKLGKVVEHGKLNLSKQDTLIEAYYQLKNIGFTSTNANSIMKGTIYFYKMTEGSLPGFKGNLGQLQGGDSFLQQIKFNARNSKGFKMMDMRYLQTAISRLIITFSGPLDYQYLFDQLSKQFIQPLGPEIKTDINQYAKPHLEKLMAMVQMEQKYLSTKVNNLFNK